SFNRRDLVSAALAAPLLFASGAAAAKEKAPPGADWGKWFHDWFGRDFGMIGYYAKDNEALLASRARVDVVFMGDSITEGWFDKRPGFFTPGRVDRGIGGQTTSQMVLRMMSDVVALRPRAVHIMGGTNDIAGNTGPMTAGMSENNMRAMTDIAQRQGIRVMIASVPPATAFPWAPTVETRPAIFELNRRLVRLAGETGATFVDYRPALDDGTGAMKAGLASDGVHPTEAGYDAMAAVVEPVLKRMLA
ncbi:MAG TPA: GDSL-type esterase/lipase family protein, partial [Sphingomicrobium sp.]|nr:GDSL-type esterase/lipase family protein [Sphingomicrobium sp.]